MRMYVSACECVCANACVRVCVVKFQTILALMLVISALEQTHSSEEEGQAWLRTKEIDIILAPFAILDEWDQSFNSYRQKRAS